jgi:hypothetical protein
MSLKRHLTAGIALTVGLVALTGTALAAPPTTPPGQEKQAETQAEQDQAAATAPENRGQEQKAAKAEASSAISGTTAVGINATTAGVKPSNSTDKNTWCETGGSGTSTTCTRNPHGTNPPDSSKRYGNGTTAAQIATSHGAPAGTDVYGPGNSQPHKVCGKNGHFIDVHAVKSYVGVCATALGQASRITETSTPTSTSSTSVTSSTSQTATTSGTAAAGGSAGVAAESGSPQSGPAGSGGVLGAFGVAGAAGTLPFTGFSLWLAILVAIALIALGWTLYRYGRLAARDLV